MARQTRSTNKVFWVVVADESDAIVYAHDSRSGPLRRVHTFNNAVARLKTEQLISDTGGRSFDSKGKGRHTMVREQGGPKSQAATNFAKEIAERIAKVMHEGSCRGFALMAAPHFLGLLRHAVSIATKAEPYATVDKELVAEDAATVRRLLSAVKPAFD